MTTAEQIQSAARFAKIADLIDGTIIKDNDYTIPDAPGRYFVVEKASGEWVWGISCETLEECARDISESDTEREDVVIFDLDSAENYEDCDQLTPILEVTRIMGEGVDHLIEPSDWMLRHLLKQRFPWLGTDDEAEGSQTVDQLNVWWEEVGGEAAQEVL